MTLEDMDEAVALILKALECREAFTVYGDFDADGFTATALLYNFFSSLGAEISYYIPDRLLEGYGLHPEALKKIAGKGPGVVITVDCGTSDQDQIALARTLGAQGRGYRSPPGAGGFRAPLPCDQSPPPRFRISLQIPGRRGGCLLSCRSLAGCFAGKGMVQAHPNPTCGNTSIWSLSAP
jgi:hypothetical protein